MSAREIDMLHGTLWNKIIVFAIPLVLTGIFEQLFNAADTLILGRYDSAAAMAAVGNNTPLVGLIIYLFLGLSLGANVLIAQALGAGRLRDASRTVHAAILLALFTGLAVAALGECAAAPVMDWLGVPEEVLPLALTYFRILLLGMPFLCLYNFIAAILRSRGDTRTPFRALFLASLLNILLDLLFIPILGWGAAGAALATDLAFLGCAAHLLRSLLHQAGVLRLEPRLLRVSCRLAILRRICAIGLPAAAQGMMFDIANLVLQAAINSLGEKVMAASAAAFTIEILLYYGVFSLNQTCTTFVGQNYGARNLSRCRRAAALCLAFAVIIALLNGIFALLTMHAIFSYFTSDPEVIRLAETRIEYVVAFSFLCAIGDTLSAALRGYGNSIGPAVIAFFAICGSRLAWVFLIFPSYRTFANLLLCYPLSWILAAVLLGIYYRTFMRHLRV